MTPSELANKIAEEVFRTIERERGIVKAEIVDAVTKVLAVEFADIDRHISETSNEVLKRVLDAGSITNQGSLKFRLGEWKAVNAPGVTLRNVTLPEEGDWRKIVVEIFGTFDQKDGPSKAYYELLSDEGQRRFTYATFAWQSDDALKIVSRVADLAAQMKAKGADAIVWRRRPEFTFENGKHRFYCRFHVFPYGDYLTGLHGHKPEGAETPEA